MIGHRRTSSSALLPADGWRSARRCGPDGGNCVEVNLGGGIDLVGIRDSKPVAGPALVFGAAGWRSFLAATITDGIRA